ncbi:MAG: hypothetical protein WCO25_04965 [Candidatus Uhrbacteria bacterium]
MFFAQVFGLIGRGNTQEDAVANCMAKVAKRVVSMTPVGTNDLSLVPNDVAEWLPKTAPDGYRLVVIGYHHDAEANDENGAIDFSRGEASFEPRAEWRCCAVKANGWVTLPSGGIMSPSSCHGQGAWTIVHRVFGSDFMNGGMNCRDCDLPKGSMEYVRGYWLPCRSVRFARPNPNYLEQNPGPPNGPGNLLLR